MTRSDALPKTQHMILYFPYVLSILPAHSWAVLEVNISHLAISCHKPTEMPSKLFFSYVEHIFTLLDVTISHLAAYCQEPTEMPDILLY